MENMGKVFVFGLLLVMLFPFASAGVQIQSYTITPTILKPGMSGNLQVILNNPSSDEFITAAYINSKAAGIGFSNSMKIGDLGALGTTNVAIPFTIRQDASPGIVPVTLEVTYTSSLISGSNYKSFSIPLTISTTNLIRITDVKISKETIYPGDTFTIDATIENAGGQIKNAILTYSSTSTFTFDGTNKVDIGNLNGGDRKKITIPVIAGNAITSGYYSIAFTLNYDDAVTAGNTETVQFGPITAVSDYSKFTITAETIGATPGGNGIFKIIVKNMGSNDLKYFKISLLPTATFYTPLDFTEKTIDLIKAGETKDATFEVGIGTNILAQVYSLPLSLNYQTKGGEETVTKNVGVKIAGAPALSIYISSNPTVITNDNKKYTLSVQVSNTGNSALRALSVKAYSEELDILTPPEAFIGTLSLDDYSTVQYDTIVKKGVNPGKHSIQLELNYKDSYNIPHMEKKEVVFEVFPSDIAALAGKQNGTDPVVMIVIVIVILIAVYFGYKRFFKSSASQKLKLK
jgi:hypothetical protein